MAKINWLIGCSGFHYKEWKGIFYPESLPQKEWFKFIWRTSIPLNTVTQAAIKNATWLKKYVSVH